MPNLDNGGNRQLKLFRWFVGSSIWALGGVLGGIEVRGRTLQTKTPALSILLAMGCEIAPCWTRTNNLLIKSRLRIAEISASKVFAGNVLRTAANLSFALTS
jgi:hypothetical protein